MVGAAAARTLRPPGVASRCVARRRAPRYRVSRNGSCCTRRAWTTGRTSRASSAAWARLPSPVRDRWQLVMVCAMDDPTRNHLVHLAREAGIEARLLLAGLRPRRRAAAPLPVDRSLRVPVAVRGLRSSGRRSVRVRRARSVRERRRCRSCSIPPPASNPPTTTPWPAAIDAGADRRATSGSCSTRRRAARVPGWDAVADRTAEAYERELARSRPAARRRPLVAFVSPLPPAASGIADYSYRLLAALREHCDVEAFADGTSRVDAGLGPPRAPAGVDVFPVRSLVDAGTRSRRLRLRRLLRRQQRVPCGRARGAAPAVGRGARARGAAHRSLRVRDRRARRGARRLRGALHAMYDGRSRATATVASVPTRPRPWAS